MYRFIKYSLDFFIVLIASILLIPIFVFIGIVIKFDSKGPIFFTQKRVGRNKKLFNIYKFRTMKIDAPKNTPTHLLQNPDQYITSIGKFLRKTSLDELPQIFNILFGKMSIIGPRPALWNQYDLIVERDKYDVNSLRPGLSGWAQINGRDAIEIPDKARLDGVYALKQSFIFDTKIFFKTLKNVIHRLDIKEGNNNR